MPAIVSEYMVPLNDGTLNNCQGAQACMVNCSMKPVPSQADCATSVKDFFAPVPMCFSADSWVFVKGKGRVNIETLQEGDEVMDSSLRYTRVVSWLHKDDFALAEYLKFEIPGSDPLYASADHLLFDPLLNDYVVADKVRSLAVLSFDATLQPLALSCEPKRVICKGMYAPLTESGSFIVQNVVASCYAAPAGLKTFLSHRSANAALWAVRKGFIPFDFETVESYIEMFCEVAEFAE